MKTKKYPRSLRIVSVLTLAFFLFQQIAWAAPDRPALFRLSDESSAQEKQIPQTSSAVSLNPPTLQTSNQFLENSLSLTPVINQSEILRPVEKVSGTQDDESQDRHSEAAGRRISDEIKNADDKSQEAYDYERYSLSRALDLLRPEFASALILDKPLSRKELETLRNHSIQEGIEIALLILHGETVLISTGSGDEIAASSAAQKVLAKASFVAHTHPDENSREGPTGPDFQAAGERTDYVLTRENIYAYNQSGSLGPVAPVEFYSLYLLSLRESRRLHNEKEVREDLNLLIAEQDRLNEMDQEPRKIWLAGGTVYDQVFQIKLSDGSTWTMDSTDPLETTLDNSNFHLIYDSSGNLKTGLDKRTQINFEYKNGVFSEIVNFATPLYRFYNASNGDHKYKNTQVVDPGYVIEMEGKPIAYVSSSAGPDMAPFYNLYNPNNQENYYTLSEGEKNSLVAAGWQDKGSVGYLVNRPPDITPLYRLYNPNPGGRHHYTTDRRERDDLVKAGWRSEGIEEGSEAAGYLTLKPLDNFTIPLYRFYNAA
ncbi:MAG: hypothetical protein HYZ84_01830, partial [Candidatus Omnitrophica bacterium]|nr:hypothetical protein [Candidatus Omnitrophota bacterium]